MQRRIAAVFMALVFTVTVSTGVLSAGKTEISAIYQDPKIEVVIPSTGQMLLNPKRLPVQVEGKVQFAQILNIPWSIENHSEVGVKVDAVVSARVAPRSTLELSDRSVANDRGEDKQVFMYLDMKVTDPGVDLREDLNWFDTIYDANRQMLIMDYENERENIMTLAPANLDGTVADGGIGAFHINGDATPDPLYEWDPAKDKVTVKIVFTFRPTNYAAT